MTGSSAIRERWSTERVDGCDLELTGKRKGDGDAIVIEACPAGSSLLSA